MNIFKGNNIPGLYTTILKTILEEGVDVGPRGLKTKELSPVIVEVSDPRRRIFGHPTRHDVSIFTYIEGLWMLRGEDKPDRVGHYVKGMLPFLNPKTGKFDGAYGPRLRYQMIGVRPHIDQFQRVFQLLKKDPSSRRAICSLHQADLDWNEGSLDVPCTLTFQFLLRDNKLDMITNMRSQDAFTGFIYDTGEFQWFQEIIAGWLDVELGRYIHVDGSLHLYEKDWKKAQEIVEKDSHFTVYDHAEVLDCRLKKFDYDEMERDLAFWESACRKGDYESVTEWSVFNDFYLNLADIIMAYNLRLDGYKEEAYEIVKHNKSDLGIIYEVRWRKDAK